MQDYKKLKVWEKSHQLAVATYRVSNDFPKSGVYGLTSQLRRAAVSIPTNIAEGCGKYTQNDFAKYLNISLGSANETEYLLLLSCELNYIPKSNFDTLNMDVNEIKSMLIRLIMKIKE